MYPGLGRMIGITDSDLKLLAGNRDEYYALERAICLFKFQTAIFFPGDEEMMQTAMLIVASKLLAHIEQNLFIEEESVRLDRECPGEHKIIFTNEMPDLIVSRLVRLLENRSYRNIFDKFVGRNGGLARAAESISAGEFDAQIRKKQEKSKIVASLQEYRLRYIEHLGPDSKAINASRAIFFHWWPTRDQPSRQGKLSEGKLSVRTMFSRWAEFEGTATFIYALDRLNFDLYPLSTSSDSFAEDLIRQASGTGELSRFLGLCRYVQQALLSARSLNKEKRIPESIAPINVATPPFIVTELGTIEAYAEHSLEMNE